MMQEKYEGTLVECKRAKRKHIENTDQENSATREPNVITVVMPFAWTKLQGEHPCAI